MDFKTKLNLLFEQLNFTNIRVARYGGLDASLISRFRNGKRIPSSGSKQLQLLSHGIVLLAEEQEKIEELCNICGFSACETQHLFLKLEKWLNREDSELKPKRNVKKSDITTERDEIGFIAFSKKMDTLMSSFGVTNVSLAKSLHIDTSLISRFRTGTRNPSLNSWFPQQFCHWMAEYIFTLPPEIRENRLLPLIGEPIPNTVTLLNERLLEWMYSDFKFKDLCLFNEFLNRLENSHTPFTISPKLMESIKSVPIYGRATKTFIGINGLRNAIIHFLVFVSMHSKPYTLYLYSDQPMDWLINDPEFSNVWSLLMHITLQNKNKIHIIHNIDRSTSDLFEAIERWLPLYISGLIQSFVCEKDLKGRFHQTMFIAPQICSINASFVAGTEDSAKYLFTTSEPLIEYNYQQFQALMKYSKPLHRTYTFESLGAYNDFVKKTSLSTGVSGNLICTPSIATMPDNLFEKIIERNNLCSQSINYIKEYRKNSMETFNSGLDKSEVNEFVVMPNQDNILAGKVKPDLPSFDIYYTAEEFIQHIQNIIRLIDDNNNYYFRPLFENPFKNLIISSFDDGRSFITKTEKPITVFLLENKLMNQFFAKYLNNLYRKVEPGAYHKENIRTQLMKYIKLIKGKP